MSANDVKRWDVRAGIGYVPVVQASDYDADIARLTERVRELEAILTEADRLYSTVVNTAQNFSLQAYDPACGPWINSLRAALAKREG